MQPLGLYTINNTLNTFKPFFSLSFIPEQTLFIIASIFLHYLKK